VGEKCSTHGEGERCLQGFGWEARRERRPLGRPRRRWEDNIKMYLREIGIDGANWIKLAQESPVASFWEHGNEPSGSIKKMCYSFTTINFSKNILHYGVGWLLGWFPFKTSGKE
jgi:hypothetical protein